MEVIDSTSYSVFVRNSKCCSFQGVCNHLGQFEVIFKHNSRSSVSCIKLKILFEPSSIYQHSKQPDRNIRNLSMATAHILLANSQLGHSWHSTQGMVSTLFWNTTRNTYSCRVVINQCPFKMIFYGIILLKKLSTFMYHDMKSSL